MSIHHTKWVLSAVLAAALCVGSAANAGPARHVTRQYSITRSEIESTDSDSWAGTQPVTIAARSNERHVSLRVTSDTGGNALVRVQAGRRRIQFCSATKTPIRVKPSSRITVSVIVGTCGGIPVAPASGKISATFTR